MDDRFGPVVYSVTGAFDGTSVDLTGTATQAPNSVEYGTITVKAKLTSDGSLRGQWTSTLGTGGTFVLFPHDVPEQNQSAPGSLPEQLHTATRTLGALRLFADDVRELIGLIRRDFGQGRVVVTYHERGTEISKYATDFENDLSRLDELRYLKL